MFPFRKRIMRKVVSHTLEPTIKKIMQTDVRSAGKDAAEGGGVSLKLNSSLYERRC